MDGAPTRPRTENTSIEIRPTRPVPCSPRLAPCAPFPRPSLRALLPENAPRDSRPVLASRILLGIIIVISIIVIVYVGMCWIIIYQIVRLHSDSACNAK